jgi:hypothetical protein
VPVVDLKDAGTWAEGLQPRLRAAAVRGLWSAAARGVQTIVGEIIPARVPEPFDRGTYKAGWRAVNEPDGALIQNLEPHAAHIELGVRAANVKIGAKLIQALASWAERKGLVKKGGGVRIAWAIAKTMRKRGIFNRDGKQGLGILKQLVERDLDKIVAEEIDREVAREIEG